MGKEPRKDIRKDPATGELVQVISINDRVDFTVPQEDDDGVVPEFVNISNRIQLLTVRNNPGATIEVPRWGVVKGAQWRYLAEENKAWGATPPFMEREKKNGKLDQKYVLSEEQMIDIIQRLGRSEPSRARIRSLVDNALFRRDDVSGEEMMAEEPKSPNHFIPVRDRDDRLKVLQAENAKIRAIEDYMEGQKRKTGVMV